MKNETTGDRIRARRKELKLGNQSNLGKKVGVSHVAISQWERGETEPTGSNLLTLSRVLSVRPEWLVNGEEPMQNGQVNLIQYENTLTSEDYVDIPFIHHIELINENGDFNKNEFHGITLRFSKGTLRRAGANPTGEKIVCSAASDNAMSPVIPRGSTVAIDYDNKRLDDGKIYLVNIEGIIRIKQLYRKPGSKILLRSFNRDEYGDEEVNADSISIIGRVFWWSVLDF